jgi:hypothetical protein
MADTAHTPAWLLRPLPANAAPSDTLTEKLAKLVAEACEAPADKLGGKLFDVRKALDHAQPFATYEPAVNCFAGELWAIAEAVCDSDNRNAKLQLIELVVGHLVPEAAARICRRLAKETDSRVRSAVKRVIDTGKIEKVALPETKDGPWSAVGWLKGTTDVDLSRHKVGMLPRVRSPYGCEQMAGNDSTWCEPWDEKKPSEFPPACPEPKLPTASKPMQAAVRGGAFKRQRAKTLRTFHRSNLTVIRPTCFLPVRPAE